MKQRIKHRTSRLVVVISFIAALGLSGCSKDDATGNNRLPDGKYPMTFTAAVEGQATAQAASRAATTNNTWTAGDQVSISTNADGSAPKTYQITDASYGLMSPIDENNTLYWQTSKDQPIRAWYPRSDSRPTKFSVQADQNNGEGFQKSDMLYARQSITYDASTPPQLVFKHLPAKVVVNLKADTQNSVTEGEVKDAKVTLVNQALTSGTIALDGKVEQTADNQSITPKVNATPATTGYQQTVEALVVPQQMKDRTFIKVEAGGNTYYYTPTGNNDANLETGKQYTYYIIVKTTGLEVSLTESSEWTGSGDNPVTGRVLNEGFSASDLKPGDYYYSDGSTSDGGYREYSDGTTAVLNIMPVLKNVSGNARTVIGIVFYAGKHSLDTSNYFELDIGGGGAFHGYVVALKDAGRFNWEYGPNEESDWMVYTSADETDWNGYFNQWMIERYTPTPDWNVTHFPAADACANWGGTYAAPAGSSGWFLPSAGQLKDGIYKYKTVIESALRKANGDGFTSSRYWSSTEFRGQGSDAWGFNFGSGGVVGSSKRSGYTVRAVLAF